MGLLFRKRKNRVSGPVLPVQEMTGPDFPGVSREHVAIYESVRDATMTSAERVFALCEAIDYICRSKIQGDIVECGVWKGGSMMAAAGMLLKNNSTNRKLWLYDTFDGMSRPTASDVDCRGQNADQLLRLADPDDSNSIWCRSELREVQRNIRSTDYPKEKIRLIAGDVAETLPLEKNKPALIAMLRLDTDWYESTRIELENLFPRLAPGGVLIIDDYGHWQGCRRAVDEYFRDNRTRMFLHRIDYTGRIGIRNGFSQSQDRIRNVA